MVIYFNYMRGELHRLNMRRLLQPKILLLLPNSLAGCGPSQHKQLGLCIPASSLGPTWAQHSSFCKSGCSPVTCFNDATWKFRNDRSLIPEQISMQSGMLASSIFYVSVSQTVEGHTVRSCPCIVISRARSRCPLEGVLQKSALTQITITICDNHRHMLQIGTSKLVTKEMEDCVRTIAWHQSMFLEVYMVSQRCLYSTWNLVTRLKQILT